jgi:hypothetical protein
MKHFLPALATVACLFAASSALAATRCPLGGSENSVGDPAPGTGSRDAVNAFRASAIVKDQEAFLRLHGYCPSFSLDVQADADCDDAGRCTLHADVTESFALPGSFPEFNVVAHYSRFDAFSRSTLFVDQLDAAELGQRVDLDADDAALMFDTLSAAGLRDPNRLMGAATLSAGRLHCSTPVVPNPRTHCELTSGNNTVSVLDQAKADALNALLQNLGAEEKPRRIGAANYTAALITCTRPVVPNPVSRCTLVVEN